nr:T9SS type A sorting domain-containing protein [Tenuifilaceae bacterium]
FDPGANLDFGWTDVLTPTTAQLYDITAIDLTANLVITAPANFQVSLESESNFSQSVSISPVNTNVEETIYARYLPDVEGFVFGNISNASSGEEATVHVQGSARVILPVMETGSTADLTAETVSCIAQVTHTGGRSIIDRGVIFWAYDGVDKEIGDVGVTNENETGSFEAGEYSMAIESLGINTHYNYRAHGNNGEWDFGGIGYGETADFWTLANVPNAPTVSNITGDTVNISVNENLNPVYTEFAIYETTTNRFIQTDGSMNTSPVWQTKADWGTTIVTLFDAQLRTGNRSYNFETIARNGAEEQTSSSEATSILTLANTPNPMWVANPTQTTMDVATYTYMTDYSENSTGTLYAIKEANTEKFVQNDGTLAPDTVWNTRDDWGSKTVTGLSIATQCSFSSIATNDDGIRTEPGPATSLYTLAAVPGKLSFTNITSSTTDIEINASTNPENVEFAVSLSNGQYVQTDGTIASGAAWHTKTHWDNTTVTGLAPNTTYTFLVKARNGDYVETTTSEAESIVTLAATPGQPDLYNYNTFTDKLEFYPSYDTNPQNTEFAVQDSISGLYLQSDAYLGESQIWHAQAPASYIFGLNPGTKYAIRLKARNASDIETEWGVSRKLSTMPNVPGTPILSDTTTNSISVEIDNSSNPSNVNYAIYENNSSLFVKADGTFSDTEIWQTQAEWGTTSISNLNVNQNLSLKVKAKNDDNAETNYSSAISVYTLAKIPAAPTVEALSSSSISIAINTNENPGSVFFAIQEVTSGKYIGFYSGLQDVEDWRTYEYWQDCIISGLEGSTEYTFRVKARNSDYVETDFGPEASATTLLALPPAPTLSSPANNANDQQIPVTFSWQVVDGATSYDIEYSIYPDFSIENHSVNGITELYYEASDLDHSYTYYWHVRANNEAGTGPWSDRWIFTTISGPPEAPTLQSPANESIDQPTSLSLIWNQVNNATDYYIQVALDNEFTNLVADETYGYYNYTLNNLENGTTYYWRAKAGNSYGYSNWSEEWWFTTIEGTDTPSALNSKVGLYPNPAKKVVHLTGVSGANISVRVISELGITVLQEKLLNGNLNIQSLQAGIYLLRVESSEGITIIRFIKE